MDKILFQKDTIKITKKEDNEYCMQCEIENPNLLIHKMIDFDLLKFIYDLNTDVYEKTELNKISDSEANITFIMKNLFPDLGMPQRFAHLNVKKTVHYKETDPLIPDQILFKGELITNEKNEPIIPAHLSKHLKCLPLTKLQVVCTFLSDHKMIVANHIQIDKKKLKILPFMEKMLSLLIYKVFSRVKQFIENVVL
jgi:hypothetical protein